MKVSAKVVKKAKVAKVAKVVKPRVFAKKAKTVAKVANNKPRKYNIRGGTGSPIPEELENKRNALKPLTQEYLAEYLKKLKIKNEETLRQ